MIARLAGRLAEKDVDRVVIDIHGVGYEVTIPLSTYYELGEEGSEVTLRIYTYVKEDSLSLYGFLTAEEKGLFRLLIQISGIGPRLAVIILSGLPAPELAQAVRSGDLLRLTGIPGVGKKTAERILLEMKEKLAKLYPAGEMVRPGAATAVQNDVVSALINLGYARNVAEKAVSGASGGSGDQFESLLRAALRKISG